MSDVRCRCHSHSHCQVIQVWPWPWCMINQNGANTCAGRVQSRSQSRSRSWTVNMLRHLSRDLCLHSLSSGSSCSSCSYQGRIISPALVMASLYLVRDYGQRGVWVTSTRVPAANTQAGTLLGGACPAAQINAELSTVNWIHLCTFFLWSATRENGNICSWRGLVSIYFNGKLPKMWIFTILKLIRISKLFRNKSNIN